MGAAGLTALLRICEHRPTPIDASPVVARLIDLCELGDVLVVAEPAHA